MRDPQDYVTCYECNGKNKPLSNCCGAPIDEDILICSECKEHADIADCEVCNGTGEIHPNDDEREQDPDEDYDSRNDF